ncbi:hypothetical protein [Pseudomonas serbica]|uniref:hypothetical protein n=1 Tax=Pseudomonas serbica TaxID=2965074 RepID=UPI00237AF7E0|nr:hypothetical protein [Pseudomonas serbica]
MLINNTPMCERKFGHNCKNGTEIKADRCDFKTGVTVIKPANISDVKFCQDISEFSSFHAMHIRDDLHEGFCGYDNISFTIETCKDE